MNIFKILTKFHVNDLNGLSCIIKTTKLKGKISSNLLKIIRDLLDMENWECMEEKWLKSISRVSRRLKSRSSK